MGTLSPVPFLDKINFSIFGKGMFRYVSLIAALEFTTYKPACFHSSSKFIYRFDEHRPGMYKTL